LKSLRWLEMDVRGVRNDVDLIAFDDN